MPFSYIGAGSMASIAKACCEIALESLKGHRAIHPEEVETIKTTLREIADKQGSELHTLAIALMAKAIGPYLQREMSSFGALAEGDDKNAQA